MSDEKLMRDTIMMIRRTEGIFKKYLDRKVSYTGVYPTQHRLLMELNLNPGMSQIGLAEKFGVSAAAIAVSLKKLEKGDAPLEEALAYFAEGTELVKYCTKVLDQAEQKVVKLRKGENGEPEETDFKAEE